MFSKIQTTKSTENFSDKIEKLKEKIHTADAVVIGAGAGLSTAAGFTYSGERFEKYFFDFQKNTELRICTRADFTLTKPLRSIGHIGADTSTSTAIWMPPNRSTMTF